MNLYQNEKYIEDVKSVTALALPWEKLKDKSVMLSGATGLLGSFLIDVILEKNVEDELNCTVYALGRNEQKAKERFSKMIDSFVKDVSISPDVLHNVYFGNLSAQNPRIAVADDEDLPSTYLESFVLAGDSDGNN